MDENNKVIGYWSDTTYQLEPGIAQVSDETRLKREDGVATQDYERHLSKLDETYLKSLAKEIKGHYLRGDSIATMLAAIKAQKPTHRDRAPFEIHWLLASMAAMLLISVYLPRQISPLLKYLPTRMPPIIRRTRS